MENNLIKFGATFMRDRGTGESLTLCATDMWRAAGSPVGNGPADWLRADHVRQKVRYLAREDDLHVTIENSSENGLDDFEVWLPWDLAVRYAIDLSPPFWRWHCNLIFKAITGSPPPMDVGLQRAVDSKDDCLMNLMRTRYLDELEGRRPAGSTRRPEKTLFTAKVCKMLKSLV